MRTKIVWLVLIVSFFVVINSCSEDPIIEETFSVEGITTYLGTPVSDVQVKLDRDSTLTDSAGFYKFTNLKRGNNTFVFVHPEFLTNQITINITENTTLPIELFLDSGTVSFNGYILFEGTPIPDAAIEFDNASLVPDSLGYFFIDDPGIGNHSLRITHPRFKTLDTLIHINRKLNIIFNLNLRSMSFFPLAVGNKWYFTNYSHPDTNNYYLIREIVGTVKINDKDYYRFKDIFEQSWEIEKIYRISADTLYQRMCDVDRIYAIFDIDSGDTFQYSYCDTPGYDGSWDVTLVQKNSFERKLYYDLPAIADEEHTITFEKGVGFKNSIGRGPGLILWKYEIKY